MKIITDPAVLRAPIIRRRAVHGTYSDHKAAAESTHYDARGNKIEREYLQCVHCQFIWEKKPGSGKKRDFCQGCMGPTCGKKECVSRCLPTEKRMEILHKWGRHALRRALSS